MPCGQVFRLFAFHLGTSLYEVSLTDSEIIVVRLKSGFGGRSAYAGFVGYFAHCKKRRHDRDPKNQAASPVCNNNGANCDEEATTGSAPPGTESAPRIPLIPCEIAARQIEQTLL